jgi:hypothetical protein
MKRLYPRHIRDPFFLSGLLELYLRHLEESELQVPLKTLAFNSDIPESIFIRLMQLHKNPADAPNIRVEDFHILFSNIMFHYPTIKIWQQDDGGIFFEM